MRHVLLLAMVLSAGCQAHASPKPEAKPDYDAVRRRAEESHEDLRGGGESKKSPRPAAQEPALAAPVQAAAKAPPPVKERKGAKPDWVDGASAQYPREGYLIGVGIADERSAAQDRARGEISKIFTTQVSVTTNLSESETNVDRGGQKENTFSQAVSQNVQTASKKALEGTEVVEHWQDQATRQHYALAVLERAKAIRAVRDRISDFDQQTRQWKEEMDKATEKLPRVKAAMKLLALFKAREDLNSELRVLDSTGQGLPSPLNEAEVRPQAAKALAELDVIVDMSGGASDAVETGIVKGLNQFGMQAKPGQASNDADIVVEGKVETNPIEVQDGTQWKWARSTMTVSLKDGRSAKTFQRFDASDRQASANYKEAVRRSNVELAKKAAEQINEAITSYFENQ